MFFLFFFTCPPSQLPGAPAGFQIPWNDIPSFWLHETHLLFRPVESFHSNNHNCGAFKTIFFPLVFLLEKIKTSLTQSFLLQLTAPTLELVPLLKGSLELLSFQLYCVSHLSEVFDLLLETLVLPLGFCQSLVQFGYFWGGKTNPCTLLLFYVNHEQEHQSFKIISTKILWGYIVLM